MVYRITYLVLDCHATLSGHSTRRGKPDRDDAKPDKLLAGSTIFSPFRGLNTESCSNFIEPTGRNRLSSLTVKYAFSLCDQPWPIRNRTLQILQRIMHSARTLMDDGLLFRYFCCFTGVSHRKVSNDQ